MISTLPPHDFLKGTDFENSEFLNQVLAFLNANTTLLGTDITKQGVTKIPFINGTDDPSTISVDKPTWIGYNDSIWLVVPDGSSTKAYNITNLIQTGGIKKINNVEGAPADGNLSITQRGDINIVQNTPSHTIIVDSSAIDAKIKTNSNDIADNTQNIGTNTQNITENKGKIKALGDSLTIIEDQIVVNKNDINTNKNELNTHDTRLVALEKNTVQNLTSSDGSINISNKTNNTIDIKAVGGGGGSGTVKAVGGINPDANGNIGIQETTTTKQASGLSQNNIGLDIKISSKATNKLVVDDATGGLLVEESALANVVKTIEGVTPDANGNIVIEASPTITVKKSTNPNAISFDVELSKDPNNTLSILNDGLNNRSSGGGASVLDTINRVSPVNKNINIADPTGSLNFGSSGSGVIDVNLKLDPAVDNALEVSPANGVICKAITTIANNDNTLNIEARTGRTLNMQTKISPDADNIIKKTPNGIKATADATGLEFVDSIFYDDTYKGSDIDGTYAKPFPVLSVAVTIAAQKSTSEGRLYTVRARETASQKIGAGETLSIGSATDYAWVRLYFPNRILQSRVLIDFGSLTAVEKNDVYITCGTFAGSFEFSGIAKVATLADQKDGINIWLDCDYKVVRSDQRQFELLLGSIVGIPAKSYINYYEKCRSLIETPNVGTLSNIFINTPSGVTNFQSDLNVQIESIDSSDITQTTPIQKVNYIEILDGTQRSSSVSLEVDLSKRGRSVLYDFDASNADRKFIISDEELTTSSVKTQFLNAGSATLDSVTMNGELTLDKIKSPVSEGGIAYDRTDRAITYMTDSGLVKISPLSSDSTVKTFMASKRVTVEDIIETNYEKKSIFIPTTYMTEFNDNSEIPKRFMEIDEMEIGIRRKDVIYNAGTTDQIIYSKNELLGDHDFTANPTFNGLAYLKMASISNVSIIDAADPNLNLDLITLTIGGGLTEDQIRELLKAGFVYTFDSTAHGKTYSFILYDIVSVASTGVVILKGFSNIFATINIPTETSKPFMSLTQVQALQGTFNELYFGDRIDFVFNKSFVKAKTRESMFPQYFPLMIQGVAGTSQKATLLVPYNSRMLVNKGKSGLTIGDKALISSMLPPDLIKFFLTKWNIKENQIAYQTLGLPLMIGIIDDVADADKNDCREFMPMKIDTWDNNFMINLYAGYNSSVLSKAQQSRIFKDVKVLWSAVKPRDILAGSEDFISSFAQDCAYINELTMSSVPRTVFSTPPYSGFPLATGSVVNGNDIVYMDSPITQSKHYREGFLGLSTEFNTTPAGQVRYTYSTNNENINMYCRQIKGAFLSPLEVKSVNIVREAEKPTPPTPSLRDVYATVSNDQNKTFNSVRFI